MSEEPYFDRVNREFKRDHFWQWVWYYKVERFRLELQWRWTWLLDVPDWEGNGIRTGNPK